MPESELTRNPNSVLKLAMDNGPEMLADMEYLGFWPRVLATIVDVIVSSLVIIPIFTILFGDDDSVLVTVIGLIPTVAYSLVFWFWKCATPGKMIFNAIIVDAKTGKKPSKGAYIMRFIGYLPAFFSLGLGFLWVAWDPQKRGWHDLLAGTIVVRPRKGSQHRTMPPVPQSHV